MRKLKWPATISFQNPIMFLVFGSISAYKTNELIRESFETKGKITEVHTKNHEGTQVDNFSDRWPIISFTDSEGDTIVFDSKFTVITL